jgi:AraC-like DNA-binding protein
MTLGSTLLAPPPALADVVEAVWDVDVPDAAVARGLACRILPSTSTVMVVHYRSPISSDRRGFEGRLYKSVVTGVQRQAVTLSLSGDTGSMVVRFKPDGAARVFGAAMAEFADANIELADIVGTPALLRLQDQLATAGDPGARLRAMHDFLNARLRASGFDPLLRHAVRALKARPATPVTALARDLDISERHLARRFVATVGVAPKQFARVARVEHMLSARWRNRGWAEIALDCGFTDQAHMINDFRALTGSTPEAFLRGILAPAWRAANARLAMSGFCNTTLTSPAMDAFAINGGHHAEQDCR